MDFVDFEAKILYEIKPNSNKENATVKLKETAAKEWCKINEYEFIFISEDYFKGKYKESMLDVLVDETKDKMLRNLKQFL